jgi:hypothetical protein
MDMGFIGIVLGAILAYFIVVRMGALALQLTGIEPEVAKFQALSALTGTGFTTTEAERVVRHRARRRIVTILIIVGNAGLLTIIGALIVSFTKVTGYRGLFIHLAILIAGILVLYRLIAASRFGNRVIAWFLRPFMRRALSSSPGIEEIYGVEKGWSVSLVTVKKGSKNIDSTISSVGSKGELEILAIDRPDVSITRPSGEEKIQEGDRLLVYGSGAAVKRLGA